jgi:hypothetical protein
VEVKEEARRKEKDGKRIRDHAVDAMKALLHRMRECGTEEKTAKMGEELGALKIEVTGIRIGI